MVTITVLLGIQQRRLAAREQTLLSEVLTEAGIFFQSPCGGKHTCGKCRVWASGCLSEPTPAEQLLLGKARLADGIRLACMCRVLGEAVIRLEPMGTEVMTWTRIPHLCCTEQGVGFACDIGTTTVALRLYDRTNGQLLAEAAEENAQRIYGADVIARIQACREHGVSVLSGIIRQQLDVFLTMSEQHGIEKPVEGVITGNTTMLHIFAGLDPASLAAAPFRVPSHFGRQIDACVSDMPVYLPRCVGAYVGADTVCAVLASGMLEKEGVSLLADIGTNGEIVLYHNGELLCCSAAAGPAFEGVGLSSGMPAAPGAVCKAWAGEDGLHFETIGEKEPVRGICGSGIIDLLAAFRRLEILDESGYLAAPVQLADSKVSVTPADVRSLQLAKAAVCAGICTLLHEAGLTAADICHFYVAGGFGSCLNPSSAAAIGLFPAELQTRVSFIGNAALGGAVMMLLDPSLRAKAEAAAGSAREIELSRNVFFMEKYIDCMEF